MQKDLRNLILRNSRKAGRTLQKEIKSTVSKRAVSSPGEPFGLRTGRRRKSIRQIAKRSNRTGAITIRIGSGDFRVRLLELGTRFMKARPTLFPAFKRLSRRMAEIIVRGGG